MRIPVSSRSVTSWKGARAEVNGHAQELGPGDCCFFPADAMHVFTVISDEPVKLLVVYAPPYEESPDRVIRPK